jgi:TonB family protein
MELAPLTVLKKQYTIKRTLGTPGLFDIVYLGQDVDSKDQYIIREYFPSHLVRRESGKTSVEVKEDENEENASLFQSGLEYFQKESRVLAELEHEALSSAYHLFEANGTFYRVRPQRPSMSLARGLDTKGTISEKAALTIMIPVLEALHEAHESGLYHGGVSPSTVRLLEDGKVLLTGFRGAFIQLARQSGRLSDLVQPGTSAIEQYTPRGNQGPWTDVYAAAATICEMVTGEKMPEATDRLGDTDPLNDRIQDADVFSTPGVREVLIEALTVDPSKRLQSVEALTSELKESSTRYDESEAAYSIIPVEPRVDTSEEEEEGDADDVEVLSTGGGDRSPRAGRRRSSGRSKKKSNRMALFIGVPLLLGALGVGAWFVATSGGAGGGSPAASYAELRTQADSLFESQQYDRAEMYYERALETRENDQYVLDRLDRITEVQAQASEQRFSRRMQQGDSLRQVGNQRFQNGQMTQANQAYNRAMGAYFAALDISPESEQAQQRVEQIESRQETIARQQATSGGGQVDVDQIASFFQEQGNRQLEAGNLQAALRRYQQAQEYRPDDPSLQQAIADLQQEIERRRSESEYESAFTRGRRLMRQQDYAEARAAFETALAAKSTGEARQALSRADSLIQVETSQQTRYSQLRARADSAYQQGNLEAAIQAYRSALNVKPGDDYAAERLERARRELEELQLAQAKQEQEAQREASMKDEDGIYTVVDQEPRVKGGLGALHRDVEYPESAARRGVEGRVYIRAVVNPDGSVREANVARGIGGGCDREALRVVRDAEFVPAKVNGEPVPAYTTVWIQFSLQS